MSNTDTSTINPLDYNKLREYGLDYIRKVAHKNWTDFNVHDPGVTIVEALCLGLTDLAYRTNFDIKDLLTPKPGNGSKDQCMSLYPAEEILSSNPNTPEEYRKLILEHLPFVRNAWVYPTTKRYAIPAKKENVDVWADSIEISGYYDVEVELDDSVDFEAACCSENGIHDRNIMAKHRISDLLYKHRNTCEDFNEIRILKVEEITIDIELETAYNADLEFIAKELYDRVSHYIAPCPKHYSLSEMMMRGKAPEDIYRGCLPETSFIDLDELKNIQRKRAFYRSDILNLVKTIDGVVNVNRVNLVREDGNITTIPTRDIFLDEEKDKNTILRLRPFPSFTSRRVQTKSNTRNYSSIVFRKNGALFEIIDRVVATNRSTQEQIAESKFYPEREGQSPFAYPIELGRYRDTDTYYSIGGLFPSAYRQGSNNKAGVETSADTIARLQFKGYLTFFDQFLADYIQQLDSLSKFFSIGKSSDEDLESYFFRDLSDEEIKDVSEILYDKFPYRSRYKCTADEENPDARSLNLDRRNRVLDHLLARFNESFVEYTSFLFLTRYDDAFDYFLLSEYAYNDKKRLLSDYPAITANRSVAVNYGHKLEISGLEMRILKRLGVDNPKAKFANPDILLDSDARERQRLEDERMSDSVLFEKRFGLHIIEHLVLIPEKGLDENSFLWLNSSWGVQNVQDPYSFRATVLLPKYLKIGEDKERGTSSSSFVEYVEEVIKEEFPAHLAPIIGWVDSEEEMALAENAYEHLLDVMSERNHPGPDWVERQYKAICNYNDVFKEKKVYVPGTPELEYIPVKNPPIKEPIYEDVPYTVIEELSVEEYVSIAKYSAGGSNFDTEILNSLNINRYICKEYMRTELVGYREIDQGFALQPHYVQRPGHTEIIKELVRVYDRHLLKIIEEADEKDSKIHL